MYTPESQKTLDRRIAVGEACLTAACPEGGEDDETAARDAISDILTRVLGPRGYSRQRADGEGYEFVGGSGIVDQARELLDLALESWRGDWEDYDEEPKPKEVRRLILEITEEELQQRLGDEGGSVNAVLRDYGYAVTE